MHSMPSLEHVEEKDGGQQGMENPSSATHEPCDLGHGTQCQTKKADSISGS